MLCRLFAAFFFKPACRPAVPFFILKGDLSEMFCPKCGAPLDDGAKFCSSCGETVNNEPEQTVSADPTPANAYTYTIPENPNQQVFNATIVNANGNTSGGGAAIASLVLGIVSFVCCCCGITAIPGIICGILGLKSDKRGIAIAGLIISSIVFGLWLISVITSVATGSYNEYFEMLEEIQSQYY